MHHDFVRLSNGNTLLPTFVEMPPELAREVRGGYRDREKTPPMISDDFIEVDPKGNEVRRIHLWQLLDPRRDPICPLERRRGWTHTNSLDVTQDGDIVFSCRQNSRIGIIDGAGELVWKYGAPNIHHQHHASALANGNVQVFDNGMHRIGMPRSAVLEIKPSDSTIAWQYVDNPEIRFFSGHISGAERLPGGNVLVCEGAAGRVFEITPKWSGGLGMGQSVQPNCADRWAQFLVVQSAPPAARSSRLKGPGDWLSSLAGAELHARVAQRTTSLSPATKGGLYRPEEAA